MTDRTAHKIVITIGEHHQPKGTIGEYHHQNRTNL